MLNAQMVGEPWSYQGPGYLEMTMVLACVVAGLIAVLALVWTTHRSRLRRLDVLQKALADDSVDAETRRSLLAKLDAPGGLLYLMSGPGLMRLLVIGGWITFLFGITVYFISSKEQEEATMAAVIGFGLMTVPFVIREFEARRSEPLEGHEPPA